MEKLLIYTTWGPTDPTRVGLAFTYAKVAKKEDSEVVIFLLHDAVSLARQEMVDHVVPIGPPLLKDSLEYLLSQGVKIYVCKPCFELRGMKEQELIQGAELKGMDLFFELSKERKLVTF